MDIICDCDDDYLFYEFKEENHLSENFISAIAMKIEINCLFCCVVVF